MFENNKVDQNNITANGSVSGRDTYNQQTYIQNSFILYRDDTVLKSLLLEHEQEKNHDSDYREFSEELNKFFSTALRNNLRNLEQKLNDGRRDYLIDLAIESKERVTKKIQKFSYYKSAQDIYTYLLTNIRTAFLHEVKSKITSGNYSIDQIDDIVSLKIIDPFLHNLQGSSLRVDKDELYGLLYFLKNQCSKAR